MNLTTEFDTIREWADKRGIYAKADSKTQLVKLVEEMGELSRAILKNNEEELKDAVGDCVVVLTNIAALNHLRIEDCINSAYDVISARTGKMVNGAFKKDN